MKRKKHIESFFISNDKKFLYYFRPNLKKKKNNYFNRPLERNFFGLKYFGSTRYISINTLKSIIKVLKVYFRKYKLKNDIDFKININPDIILTSKPREVRMGKGKGQPLSNKVGILYHGQILLELHLLNSSKRNFLVSKFLKTCSSKLPFRFNQIQSF